MNALLVKDGVVVNAIVVENLDEAIGASEQPDQVFGAATVEPAWIGRTWDGASFSQPN